MKRRGFTLVELSIVLVIIGILLGMVIKGKSLIKTAKLKAEIAHFTKLKMAATTYFGDYRDKSSKLTKDDFIKGGYLQEKDFILPYSKFNLILVQQRICYYEQTHPTFCAGDKGQNIMVIVENAYQVDPKDVSESSGKPFYKYPLNVKANRYTCVLDVLLDDGLLFDGDIRAYYSWGTGTISKYNAYTITECENPNSPITYSYAVLIHSY